MPPGLLPAPAAAAVMPPPAPAPASAAAPAGAAPALGDVPQTPSMIWRRLDRTSLSAPAAAAEPPDRPLQQSISNVWAQINAVRSIPKL